MKASEEFLKRIGESGFPKVVNESLRDTWHSYHPSDTPETPEERILDVLGFFYIIRQAGSRSSIKGISDPMTIYKAIRQEEFDAEAKTLASLLSKYRVFDVLRVFKSKYTLLSSIRGDNRTFRLDLCLEPKRSEPLDSALAKLRGMLYIGDLPRPLMEQWKKLPIKSTAKHKSLLPKYSRIVAGDSVVGFEPLDIGKKSSVYAKRAADDMLVLRTTTTILVKPVPWINARKLDESLRLMFSKSFSKLKG